MTVYQVQKQRTIESFSIFISQDEDFLFFGFIQVPEEFPGLGVQVDEEKIKQLSNIKLDI